MAQAKRQVARAAVVITLISVFSKLLGFIREQVIASLFGATGLTDAYFSAWAIPLLLVGLFGGAISTAFLPVFLRALARGEEEQGWNLAASVWRLSLLTLTAVTALSYLVAPQITRLLVPDFDPAVQALTVDLLRVMLPAVLFLGIATLYSALLNARKQFAWPAMGPVMMNIALVGSTFLFTRRLGIMGLAWSTLLGVLAQQLLLWWHVRRQQMPVFRWRGGLAESRQVIGLALPILLGTLFSQLYVFVDKGLASGLDAGSIASLNYASKLVQLPIGVFVAALATAIYPALAELAGRRDHAGLARAVAAGVRTLTALILPAAVGMAVLRRPLVALAFQRGSFDAAATEKTAFALLFYAVGLVGLANIQVLTRAFYALEDAISPVRIGIVSALLNIALDIVLVGQLRQGGLALANSVAVLVQMVWLMWLLRRRLHCDFSLTKPLLQIALAAAVMGMAVAIGYSALIPYGSATSLIVTSGLGVLVYAASLWLLGYDDMKRTWRMVLQRLGVR